MNRQSRREFLNRALVASTAGIPVSADECCGTAARDGATENPDQAHHL